MKKYRVLFFDLDHTLWDFETNSVATLKHVYQECELANLGIEDFDQFNLVYHEINDKLWDKFRKGLMSREDLRWKRMWQTLLHYKMNREDIAKIMAERYLEILAEQQAVFPYTHELLQYCKDKSYELHLITNGFEATQKMKLKNADLEKYFDQMITSEMAMSMKPKKEIFHFALKATEAKVEESLMIGDALDVDILGAQHVGMDSVYFNPHGNPHHEEPTYEIKCLSELLTIL